MGNIPVKGALVNTEALGEYWRSPKAIIPEDVVFKGVAPYMKTCEDFILRYGLELVWPDVSHHKDQKWLVKDAKVILRQNLRISVSNLKKDHADMIRHACMAAAHGATSTLLTGDGAIVEICIGNPEKLGISVVHVQGFFGGNRVD
jgi:hypothetical protein